MTDHTRRHDDTVDTPDSLDALLARWGTRQALSDARAQEIHEAVLAQVGAGVPLCTWRPSAVFTYEWWAAFSDSMARALDPTTL